MRYFILRQPIFLGAIILIGSVVLSSWSLAHRKDKLTRANYHQEIIPPNCVPIGPNLYMDKTEISNIHWLEYLHWNSHVFGTESEAYQAALPDSTIWTKANGPLHKVGLRINDTVAADYYLRHPAYRDYPVAGITQEQAKAYAQWRSDRVFEYLLINSKMIDHETDQNAADHFTIERYLGGEFKGYTPRQEVTHVPVFRLPTEEEWRQGLVFSDSLHAESVEGCRGKKCRTCDPQHMYIHSLDSVETYKEEVMGPTAPIFKNCISKDLMIYGMRGNVSEWCQTPDMTLGGSWLQRESEIMVQTAYPSEEATAWIGMRCICEWVPVKDLDLARAK